MLAQLPRRELRLLGNSDCSLWLNFCTTCSYVAAVNVCFRWLVLTALSLKRQQVIYYTKRTSVPSRHPVMLQHSALTTYCERPEGPSVDNTYVLRRFRRN